MEEVRLVVDTERPVTDGQGEIRWLKSYKRPLRDASGEITGIVGANMDITELKETEESLAEAHSDLKTFMDTIPAMIA